MQRLVLIGGALAIGLGLYAVNPPRIPEAPAGRAQALERSASRSMVARLAEAGLAMRRQNAPIVAEATADQTHQFFGSK